MRGVSDEAVKMMQKKLENVGGVKIFLSELDVDKVYFLKVDSPEEVRQVADGLKSRKERGEDWPLILISTTSLREVGIDELKKAVGELEVENEREPE